MHALRKIITGVGLAAALAGQPSVMAQTIYQFSGINKPIPDGSVSGVTDQQVISVPFTSIGKVVVTLDIAGTGSGAFNGDFYAYLSHGSELAVLLNRPGRRADNPVGYGDSGFSSLVFDADAANGDVHRYRLELYGDEFQAITPYPSPLTGTWAPDGRTTSPASTLDTDPRPADLSIFDHKDPNGKWTLFLADLETIGTATLVRWGLIVSPVPEPAEYATICATSLVVLGVWRRRARARK
jgi:hypothetical protein